MWLVLLYLLAIVATVALGLVIKAVDARVDRVYEVVSDLHNAPPDPPALSPDYTAFALESLATKDELATIERGAADLKARFEQALKFQLLTAEDVGNHRRALEDLKEALADLTSKAASAELVAEVRRSVGRLETRAEAMLELIEQRPTAEDIGRWFETAARKMLEKAEFKGADD